MKKPLVGISAGIIVALVLGSGATFAYKAKLFTSPKNVLLQGIQQETFGSANNLMAQPASFNINLEFDNLSIPQIPSDYDSLVNLLNGASMNLNTTLDTKNEKAKFVLNLNTGDHIYSSDVYVDQSNLLLSTSGFVPLLNQLSQAYSIALPHIPPYVTDLNDPQVQQFWNEISLNKTTTSPQYFSAGQQLAELVIQPIPDRYFTRPSLNTIKLSIPQNGWQKIIKYEIKSIYSNPQPWVDVINVINKVAGNHPPITAAELTSTPESTVLESIDQMNQQGVFSMDPTVISVTKNLFSNQEDADIQGGFTYDQPYSFNSDIKYHVQSSYGTTGNVVIPATNSTNSESFNNLLLDFYLDQYQGYSQN